MKGRSKGPRKGIFHRLALILAFFLLTIPLQLLVQWRVVTGIPPEGAHSHAHAEEHGMEGEHEHEHEGSEEEQGEEPEVNIIPNYGFEVGTREQAWGWYPKVVGPSVVFRDEKVKRMGSASGAVVGEAAWSGPSGWVFVTEKFPKGRGMYLRGYVLSEVQEGGAFILLRAMRRVEGGGTFPLAEVCRVRAETLSQWEEVSVEAPVPEETDLLEVEVGFFGSGKAWFDDLALQARDVASLPTGKNVILNPAFEEGLEEWLPFGEREDGDVITVEGPKGRRTLILRSSEKGVWGVCQGLSGLPEGSVIGMEITAGSRLKQGRAYLDLFLFYLDGPRRVRVGELSGAMPPRGFSVEVPVEDGLVGVWVGLAVDGVGTLQVEGVSLSLE